MSDKTFSLQSLPKGHDHRWKSEHQGTELPQYDAHNTAEVASDLLNKTWRYLKSLVLG